jgi:superfamily I DNA/RNA helicase
MSIPVEDGRDLTGEQRLVVGQPAEAKVLLTASAGSGKTHTLVRRLDALTARHDLAAGEILVLTFSRAAVRELGGRLAGRTDAVRHIRALTFDSWALRVLNHSDAVTDWAARSFDERIRAATDVIIKGRVDDLYEDDLLHVVIDEVQDLVGVRRELVESLLDRYDCGFTVVGDLAQAIYGFQVDPAERAGEAGRFVQWLRVTFGPDLVELELTENFRARTDEARIALAGGAEVRRLTSACAAGPSFAPVHRDLRTRLLDTLPVGNLSDEFVQDTLRGYEGTCAILCRNNGQALVVSEKLHAGRVPHRLQTSARDHAVPGWLALLFPPDAGSLFIRDEFESLIGDLRIDRDTVWRQMTRVAGSGIGRVVDRGRLAAAVRGDRLPDDLTAPEPASLTVSSIHRAKGLEFDRVVIVEPETDRQGERTDVSEETRLLYVAMTRARDDLFRAAAPDTALVRRSPGIDRWGRYGWRKWQRTGLELRGADVERSVPAGGAGPGALDLQHYLRTSVLAGDEVSLERDDSLTADAGGPPAYRVVHQDSVIGVTSERFQRDLRSYMKVSSRDVTRSWPRTINGGHVELTETAAGGAASGRTAGLGEYGIWLAPRLGGLTRFNYDSSDDQGGRDD